MNALAQPEVGKYINEYFVSSFQKVGTFRIVNGQKQGGNVAAWFCAPDGRVLHVVAGPVDGPTMLREARWVVETTKKALAENRRTGTPFKALMRQYHAEKVRQETGLAVEAVPYDAPVQDEGSALTYRDPTGRPLAPVLPPAPIDGPDVRLELREFNARQSAAASAPGAVPVLDRRGRRAGVIGNQGRADTLMAAHALTPIEKVYGSVFEGILGEKVSTKPVQIVDPFPWRNNVTPNGGVPIKPLPLKGGLGG